MLSVSLVDLQLINFGQRCKCLCKPLSGASLGPSSTVKNHWMMYFVLSCRLLPWCTLARVSPLLVIPDEHSEEKVLCWPSAGAGKPDWLVSFRCSSYVVFKTEFVIMV